MAYAIRFTPRSMSAAQYEEVHAHLDRAGKSNPDGRLHHVCYGEGDRLEVLDVWEDLEKFQAFGAVLMPVAAEVGFDPGEPEIRPLLRAQAF